MTTQLIYPTWGEYTEKFYPIRVTAFLASIRYEPRAETLAFHRPGGVPHQPEDGCMPLSLVDEAYLESYLLVFI
jgi:hypothetical protein